MPGRPQALGVPGHDEAGGAALVRFAQALSASSSLEELDRTFVRGFGLVMAVPMYGFNLLDLETKRLRHNVAPHVSDVFVSRYARHVMEEDPLRVHAFSTGRAIYNLALMAEEEWLESYAYRNAYSMHAMRHVVEAPIVGNGPVLGGVHFATSDPARDVTSREVELTGVIGGMLGLAIEQLWSTQRIEVERDQALAALEVTGTAVVFSEPGALELRFNDAARSLLDGIVEADERVHQLLIRPSADGSFSRRVDVELASGGSGVLHGHSSPVPTSRGGLVTVLELDKAQPWPDPRLLSGLTPREREVAALVVDGLTDREIAQQLYLSFHTVAQYVKRIYRKLDVGSRVELTRLLLARHPGARRG
jgi:DNA-binding CsgD family transcriptional regulator/GAF domain-containing protein